MPEESSFYGRFNEGDDKRYGDAELCGFSAPGPPFKAHASAGSALELNYGGAGCIHIEGFLLPVRCYLGGAAVRAALPYKRHRIAVAAV